MKAHVQSRMVFGARATPETEAAIRKAQRTPMPADIGFTIFETSVGHKRVYCCWSGGRMDRATRMPEFTLVGLGAFEALTNIPGPKASLIFAEVRVGPTPIQEKIAQIILDAPDGARICFVGDLAGELNGKMGPAFNPTGEPIFLPGAENWMARD